MMGQTDGGGTGSVGKSHRVLPLDPATVATPGAGPGHAAQEAATPELLSSNDSRM